MFACARLDIQNMGMIEYGIMIQIKKRSGSIAVKGEAKNEKIYTHSFW